MRGAVHSYGLPLSRFVLLALAASADGIVVTVLVMGVAAPAVGRWEGRLGGPLIPKRPRFP